MTMPAPSMSARYCAPPNSAISEVRPSKEKRMKLMFIFSFILLFVFSAKTALADEAGLCQAQGGSFLSGTVTQGPSFAAGHIRDGVELSHTHITLQAEQDGKSYDVAMDNVFASGYDAAGEAVPSPLSSIAVGDKLDLCGELYQSGGVGIHWVHTDCGKSPTPSAPNGWVKIIETDGTLGVSGGENAPINGYGEFFGEVSLSSSPFCVEGAVVLVAVKDASRRCAVAFGHP